MAEKGERIEKRVLNFSALSLFSADSCLDFYFTGVGCAAAGVLVAG